MARTETLRAMSGRSRGGIEAVAGVISEPPASRTDPVGVARADRPDHTIAETQWWNRDGDTLPQQGDSCALLLTPTLDPIVTWSPSA